MTLGDLIAGLGVAGGEGATTLRVCDLTDDSRTVLPGSLFIARNGEKTDGRQFIGAAVGAGAVAVLTDDPSVGSCGVPILVCAATDLARVAATIAERFYGEPTRKLTLIGITGTNGKTTTAHLIHQVLNLAGVRCGLIGTVLVDDGREVAPATLTTPPATELSRTFATMVETGRRAAVMEVSSHALHQGRVAALAFRVGVFTNLTGDHLDYHKTMEEYASAKAGLLAMLPADGVAIVNAEDRWSDRMVAACGATVWRCGIADGSPARGGCVATVRRTTMCGSGVTLCGPWGQFEAGLRLVGRYNVMNALQAAAACHAAGLDAGAIRAGLERAAAPPGRLEPVTEAGAPFTVLVDYAHTDDALRKVLGALRPMVPKGGRLRVVFGCGGDRDAPKRPRMGAAAAELADVVYVTSDNPRTERPGAIIEAILSGIPRGPRSRVKVDADRGAAIRRAIEESRPGDLVLIAGKGHETEQLLPDGRGGIVKSRFDDREAARAAIEAAAAAVEPA